MMNFKLSFFLFFFGFFFFSIYADFSTIDGVLDFFGEHREVFVDERFLESQDLESNDEGDVVLFDDSSDFEESEENDEEILFARWKRDYKRVCFGSRLTESIERANHRYFE
jgi:hypothetical protein